MCLKEVLLRAILESIILFKRRKEIVMAYKQLNVEITQEHFARSIKGSPRDAMLNFVCSESFSKLPDKCMT